MADTNDTPLAEREDYRAGYAAAETAASERTKAVFASEHCPGREAHAARLLGNAKLSADDIIAELPNFAKAEALDADAQREAAEAGGRAEMRDAMAAAGNADLGQDSEPKGQSASDRILAAQAKATGRKPAK